MKYLLAVIPSVAMLAVPAASAGPSTTSSITDKPATIRVEVTPQPVDRGGRARVSVTLDPVDGVKVNRYPKIRLNVPATPGLTSGGEVQLGDDRPPAIDQSAGNYFDEIEPLTLELDLDRDAPRGAHEVEGQLVFYYCVTKSGFCAPKKAPLKIALDVR